eukprot:CAMPEP_0197024608 /NCGR_PEP_ID=MMETSP1384-20130603/5122_1 /TAXON_ID=29189 /ORGANISM="Ammonia sp." /LENGTH=153 /DNA_ID=CAMNT_0042453017 /DNA_START=35 /DNA_END=496 /DNA_ORIENTATION=+
MAAQPEEKENKKDKQLIGWGSLLSVENAKLDKQHHDIVDAVNVLANNMALDNLLKLQSLFIEHLRTEQELFEAFNYNKEERNEHVKAHVEFLKFIEKEVQRVKASESKQCDPEWPNQFANMFVKHAFEYDSKYIDCLKDQQQKQQKQQDKQEK